ncbi:MAG: hypothetical protein AVDCRST_MAG47-2510 [uncultured Nocardioidaceae bacterium]|uniref:Uncharacterized protein n=1 Tax=uncultured Nocardioidaceae bacterium TaxID=253824 RepID=A0A6J4NGI4_9ACTN|nr:MAG: hypothetical protein AVDCRST_MAG47-2510 [uncultured Nocardioidaceae bacterium]
MTGPKSDPMTGPTTGPDRPTRTAKPRKHLMTPGQVRPQPARSMSLSAVQKWVMSTLAVSTLLHMAVGLVFAAYYVDERSSKIGLLVIAGAFGLISMASGLLIHRKSLVHPMMLLGLLPPLAGAWWIFG